MMRKKPLLFSFGNRPTMLYEFWLQNVHDILKSLLILTLTKNHVDCRHDFATMTCQKMRNHIKSGRSKIIHDKFDMI